MNETVDSAIEHAARLATRMFSVEISAAQRASLSGFASELIRWNRSINLTSITEPAQVAELHILDSLAVTRELPTGASVLDVGTGGGLPGIPLAIVRPDCSFRLVDRTEKKILFLKTIVARLGLSNVQPQHVRLSGDPAAEGIQQVDVAVSRAFTSAPEWIGLARNYVVRGGKIVAMLGSDEPDAEVLRTALAGDRLVRHERYELPSGARRALLIVERV